MTLYTLHVALVRSRRGQIQGGEAGGGEEREAHGQQAEGLSALHSARGR